MTRPNLLLACALVAALTGCNWTQDPGAGVGATPTSPAASEAVFAESPAVMPPPADSAAQHAQTPELAAPALTPEAEKGEKGARNVLLEWARAVEHRDFARAAAQWGPSGLLSAAEHTARFGPLGRTTVTLGEGDVEGGAGSLYYSVPLSVTGGGKTIIGEIVARRVNDVDGASAEQLRWHIERLDLQP